jgi:RTX calcium-binding nonapeptide repeat (4 copies)
MSCGGRVAAIGWLALAGTTSYWASLAWTVFWEATGLIASTVARAPTAFRAQAGADIFEGDSGADFLSGGAGRDELSAGLGPDRMLGGGDSDLIRAAEGTRDIVRCGRGRDRAVETGVTGCAAARL